MSKAAQHLLNLAGHFEKMAVDIAQPPEFKSDWEKWKEIKDPTPEDDEGAYEKWLKDNSAEEPPEGVEVIDDLPFEEDIAEKIRRLNEESDQRASSRAPGTYVPPELKADTYVRTAKAKEKKHLDPKAKVRNRGTVCVPASSAKDKKDHFPINDEDQARNALSRVHQYSAAPPWYNGSLKGLQALVSRKVHSKYPSIGKADKSSKKKSSWDVAEEFLIKKYDR